MKRSGLSQRLNRPIGFLVCLGFLCAPCLRAEDALSVPVVGAPSNGDASSQGVSLPAPAETEKAPTAVKPTAKPQFTLPEVVITGDNQLTIGAKRLDRHEDDVTRGSQELRGLSRSENDLPGLENQRTGLSALSPEAARDTVAILHGGVGPQKTWEGWGLLGMQMKGFRALLDAMGDQWGGVSLGMGHSRKRTVGWGGVLQAEPTDDLQLRFSRDYQGHRNDLPYQGGIEDRRTSATEGDIVYRFAPGWKAEAKAYYWDSHLDAGVIAPEAFQTIEREGRARVEWDAPNGLLEDLWGEVGGRLSNGHFASPALNRLDAVWGKVGLRLALRSKVFLDLSMGGTRLGGVDLKVKGEPKVELELLPGEATRVRLHVRSARTLPLYQETQEAASYTLPLSGLAPPGFIRGEVGGDVDRRVVERVLVSVGARVWDEDGRSQWTESLLALDRPIWESLGLLRCWDGRVGLKADMGRDFSFQVDGHLSEAVNRSGDGRRVTGWPRNQAVATLSRKTTKDYLALTVKGVSSRDADSSKVVTLSPYWTLGLEARRVLGSHWTVWAKGDNLCGQRFELLPGYPEPRFMVHAGLEVVF